MTFAKSLAINAVQEQAQQIDTVQSRVCGEPSTARKPRIIPKRVNLQSSVLFRNWTRKHRLLRVQQSPVCTVAAARPTAKPKMLRLASAGQLGRFQRLSCSRCRSDARDDERDVR